MGNKLERLPAQEHEHFQYVLSKDIEAFHGDKWYKKFCIVFDFGKVPVVADGPAIYYQDYLRFAFLVDFGGPPI